MTLWHKQRRYFKRKSIERQRILKFCMRQFPHIMKSAFESLAKEVARGIKAFAELAGCPDFAEALRRFRCHMYEEHRSRMNICHSTAS